MSTSAVSGNGVSERVRRDDAFHTRGIALSPRCEAGSLHRGGPPKSGSATGATSSRFTDVRRLQNSCVFRLMHAVGSEYAISLSRTRFPLDRICKIVYPIRKNPTTHVTRKQGDNEISKTRTLIFRLITADGHADTLPARKPSGGRGDRYR